MGDPPALAGRTWPGRTDVDFAALVGVVASRRHVPGRARTDVLGLAKKRRSAPASAADDRSNGRPRQRAARGVAEGPALLRTPDPARRPAAAPGLGPFSLR